MRRVNGPPVTIVLPQEVAEELREQTSNALETAGVLLARHFETSRGDLRLLGLKVVWVDTASYLVRDRDCLSIASSGYVAGLREAELTGSVAIWLHSHPGLGSAPVASSHDEVVDSQISDVFRLRTGCEYYGALITAPRGDGFAFTGYLEGANGSIHSIERLWCVGDRLKLMLSFDSPRYEPSQAFDRNVRALGSAVQLTVSDLAIAVVGCGGTGSIIVEQLIRLGARRLTLIDPDVLSSSNVTRVYGSTASDVGRRKVDVLADHALRIAPDATIQKTSGMITIESIARQLIGADLVFGCTDDNAGRLVLSRVATYLLTPVIDCGVLVSSGPNDDLIGVDARVTVLVPGQACLVCRGRVDLQRASAELLTPAERLRRLDEGYAPALGRVEPAVVTFTTAVGALAVSELLERLIGYGPDPRPSEILVRCHDREISTNIALPLSYHYCDPRSGKIGLGVTQPFLEQTWPA